MHGSETIRQNFNLFSECTLRLQKAVDDAVGQILFVSGCAENQVLFYPRFAKIILLSAPWPVMFECVMNRKKHAYGKTPNELLAIQKNLNEIEPLLRISATHEIVTIVPLAAVVGTILEICSLQQA